METSIFSRRAAGVAKMLSFLYKSRLVPILLLLLANVNHVFGQACLTGETPPSTCFNSVSLGGDQGTLSNCSFNTFPIFFHHPSINRIDFKSLHVRVRLSGDAQFDAAYFSQPADQIYVAANILTPFTSGLTSFSVSSDGKTLDWIVQCSFLGAHRIAVGPLGSSPIIFHAGIIGDPYSDNSDIVSVQFELTTISGLSQQGMQLPCPEDCCSLLASNFGIQTGGTPLFCSNSTIRGNIKFTAQFPAAPADPEEILHSVEINNTGPSVSFDELDLRIRVTDEHETMPDFGFDYSTSPLGPPNPYQ